MLKRLRIKNFKGWKDTGDIRMAPISLFFGANSSGKSSIGQLLMMLKQTVELSDRKAVFFPGNRNSIVQLGSYREMVFQRDLRKKIGFEYVWEVPEGFEFADSVHEKSYRFDTISFEAGTSGDNENHGAMLDRFKYTLERSARQPPCPALGIAMERKPGSELDYRVKAEGYRLRRKQGRAWHPGPPVRFYGFPDEVVAYHQNAGFVQDINLQHEKLFRSIFYLGPLRTKAERLYHWSGIEPEGVGHSGENAIKAVLSARNRKISLGYKRRALPFQQVIAGKLCDTGLVKKFEVRRISKYHQEYEVRLQTGDSEDLVNLPDVGVGVSQLLPVLVQCFYAPENSVIVMEQPEIHLHPSAQSALADVVIDVIHSREHGKDRNVQLIIETHSEHFLRRLQRRIAENKISGDKVAAYFANARKKPARLDELKVDEFGNILNWPDHFFGDDMGDIIAKAKAGFKRKAEKTAGGQEKEE